MGYVRLRPLEKADKDRFIIDNQEAFRFGALEIFGAREECFEEDGEIISRRTIEQAIEHGEAYRIFLDDEPVGGSVLSIDGDHGELELLFISPAYHSRGIGQKAWQEIEGMYPQVTVWETATPYFEKRNIHFYVNRCGFHIVEFFDSHHRDPNEEESSDDGDDGMFRFQKIINRG